MKEHHKKLLTKALWLLFYLYIILLSYFLFFSERYGRENTTQVYRYNLVLFKEIKRFIKYWKVLGIESFIVNIVGNIVAFAPFGFMLPVLNKRYRHFFLVTFLSLLFSVCIETIQLIFKVGIFDVDDMLLNTIGGILGYLFYAICNKIINKSNPKKKKVKKRGN